MTDSPALYDHFSATDDASVSAGVYRVVGTDSGSVTLLRVTTGNGRREHTGDVVTVSHTDLDSSFERAENPDAGFALRDVFAPLVTFPEAFNYWIRRLWD